MILSLFQIIVTMLALENFNKEEMETLKWQIENNRWHITNINRFETYRIRNKKFYVKIILFLFALNPVIVSPGIIALRLRPYWAILPSEDKSMDAMMIILYIVYVIGSCGVVYSHVLLHVYFSVCLKVQMELLTEYLIEKCITVGRSDTLNEKYFAQQDVRNWLVRGIQRHGELLR